MKALGWIMTCIGGVITLVNTSSYMSKSSEIQAWYYHRSELESARTFLILGIAVIIIGIAILLATYLKNNKN